MGFKQTFSRAISSFIPSPITVDFTTGGGTKVNQVAPLPKEVFWDTSVPLYTTEAGIGYVRTPEERFDYLSDYNFKAHYADINGLRMHYVDEGPKNGEIILMLHGQPVWSYLYRKMIKDLVAQGYRCIAPDMIGMGKSDKPIEQQYHTYDQHCTDMLQFIKHIELYHITLFCQDWGSLIGSRLVGEHPELFARFILANGELPNYTAENNPFYIPNPIVINPKIKSLKSALAKYVLKGQEYSFQAWILYCLTTPQITVSEVVDFATTSDLSPEIKAAYEAPFPSFIYCAGPRTLPSMNAGIRGQTLKAWDGLRKYDKPFLSLIGLDDRLLGRPSIQKKWIDAIPGSKGQNHERFEKANHFIQEDIGEVMADRTHQFISKNPIR
jgi:haloalkane dehalogenase